MVEIYSRALKERFYGSRCSVAYLFRACWYIALAIAPIYIAYSSGGFWRRSSTYLEQPSVHFTKSLIVAASSSDGSRVLQYSSMEKLNYLWGYQNVRQPTAKAWDVDSNLDTKADSIHINLVFPLFPSDASVVSVSCFVLFHASFMDVVPMEIESGLFVQHSGGVVGNQFTYAGDLRLRQRNALSKYSSNGVRTVYSYPIINDTSIKSVQDADLTTLMLQTEARNETLVSFGTGVWSQSSSPSTFNLSLHFTVPQMEVTYVPSASEAIKFAFIQWIAMFFILYFFGSFIRNFVYEENVVQTTRIKDGTPIMKAHQF